MLLAASPLIDVVPGLMIWTLVCFAITFFVLRKFAFGPIQATIDERRKRIRDSVEEAERARAEARKLLEEHRALIGQAKSEAGEILAEARKVAESQRERAREEIEADRQRRLEETRKQIDAETARALEQIRSEVADLTLAATAKVTGKVLDRGGSPPADRGRDRRPRLLRAGAGAASNRGRRAAHVRAGALPGRPRPGEARRRPPGARRLRRRGRRRARAARRCSHNPELDPTAKSAVLEDIAGDADELVHNFLLLVVEKGRASEIEEIYRELDALVAAEQKRLIVELTTAYELSDEEADSILKKIEAASGRSVEATRKVDPALIGGVVLQAGSLRVDASVRGRLSDSPIRPTN